MSNDGWDVTKHQKPRRVKPFRLQTRIVYESGSTSGAWHRHWRRYSTRKAAEDAVAALNKAYRGNAEYRVEEAVR